MILNEDQLREEIGFLKRTLRTKQRLASLRADRGLQPGPAKTRVAYEHSSTKITLLMDWVRVVCDFYNLKVTTDLLSKHGTASSANTVVELICIALNYCHSFKSPHECFS